MTLTRREPPSVDTLTVVLDARFQRTADGTVWTIGAADTVFWSRYLDVFRSIRILARIADVATPSPGARAVSGEALSFSPIPYFKGPGEYVLRRRSVIRALDEAVRPEDAYIIRVPSFIGTLFIRRLAERGYPYGVEVLGDSYDAFAPGAVRHPLRPFFRWLFASYLREACAGAPASAFVTARALQQRYPPAQDGYSIHCSDVILPSAAYAEQPRRFEGRDGLELVMVGALDLLYKAPDVLIQAVALCIEQGHRIGLTIVGDGKYRSYLEALAEKLGIRAHVRFRGRVPAGEAVRAELDRADVFVLPSHQEGLPRAMIEAMARALPCIGSTVGGFPELLRPSEMVPPGDAQRLAAKIIEFARDPERLNQLSRRNLELASEYREEMLRERRNEFFRFVKIVTEDRLAGVSKGP